VNDGIKGAGGKYQMMVGHSAEGVIPVYQMVPVRGPRDQCGRQGKSQYGNFDKDKVEFNVAVIGHKKEGKSGNKRRADIQDFAACVRFSDVAAEQYQEIPEEVHNNHALHKEEIVFIIGLSPEKDIDPYGTGQCQGNTGNNNQYEIIHGFMNT